MEKKKNNNKRLMVIMKNTTGKKKETYANLLCNWLFSICEIHIHNIYIINKYRYIYYYNDYIYYYDYYAMRIRVWMILRKVYILY